MVIQPAVPTSLFKILEVFLPYVRGGEGRGGFYELEQCWVRNPFPLHGFLPSESAEVLLRNHTKRSAVGKTLMPGTVRERRAGLILNLCGVRGCRVNLEAPYILYIGQTYRYSPKYAFYIFRQQIYLIIFLEFNSPSSFIPPQNVVYFLMLSFLVHKILTFYINGVLNCKCPAPRSKG